MKSIYHCLVIKKLSSVLHNLVILWHWFNKYFWNACQKYKCMRWLIQNVLLQKAIIYLSFFKTIMLLLCSNTLVSARFDMGLAFNSWILIPYGKMFLQRYLQRAFSYWHLFKANSLQTYFSNTKICFFTSRAFFFFTWSSIGCLNIYTQTRKFTYLMIYGILTYL